jgi:CRISPR-associated protein (TIGR03984 family)
MKNNGLKYNKVNTSSKPVGITSDEDILENAPQNAWFISYLFHRVVIGQIKNGQFEYYQDTKIPNDVTLSNMQKLRVFNKDTELFVWRTNSGKHKARLRIDGNGLEQGVVDANQVLFGTKAEILDQKYSILKEDRGTEIILPLTELGIKVTDINKAKGRLCIHTRSYVGFIEETGQATYEDVRFVKFVKYQEEKQ